MIAFLAFIGVVLFVLLPIVVCDACTPRDLMDW